MTLCKSGKKRYTSLEWKIKTYKKPPEAPGVLVTDNARSSRTCGIVLFYRGCGSPYILTVHEKLSDRTGFPKGKRKMFISNGEWSEEPFEAAKRELKEETSIDLDQMHFKKHYRIRKYYKTSKNILDLWVVEIFNYPRLPKKSVCGIEVDSMKWVPAVILKRNFEEQIRRCDTHKRRNYHEQKHCIYNDSVRHFFWQYKKFESLIRLNEESN